MTCVKLHHCLEDGVDGKVTARLNRRRGAGENHSSIEGTEGKLVAQFRFATEDGVARVESAGSGEAPW